MKIEKQEAGQIIMKALLEKQKFSAEEEALRFEQACSPDYWRKLNPQLHVVEDLPFQGFEGNPIEETVAEDMLSKLKREGYFSTGQPLINREVTEKMLTAIENLRKEGWHELWAFVYDEFWQVTRTPSFVNLLEKILGKNFKALPHVIVHYVHPETGAGWSPHIDFSDRDNRFTVWFSISDATLDNGCMYVIAKNRVSDELLQKWKNMEEMTHREVKTVLQNTHALPVSAGSILAWEGDVIHWGAASTKKVYPRISLSVVYLQEDMEPLPDEIPLLCPQRIPSFAQRMLSIGKAANFYNIHVLALNKFSDIGRKLIVKYREAST